MKLLEGIVGVDRSRGTQTDPRSLGAPSPADRRKTTPSGPVSPGVARAGPGIRGAAGVEGDGTRRPARALCARLRVRGSALPGQMSGSVHFRDNPPPQKKKVSFRGLMVTLLPVGGKNPTAHGLSLGRALAGV